MKNIENLRQQSAYDMLTNMLNEVTITNKFVNNDEREVITTGSLRLDKILGGGLARGTIVEVFGPQDSGKTALALGFIKEFQRKNLSTALIDVDCKANVSYIKNLKIDLDDLLYSRGLSAEDSLETVKIMIKEGIDLVVIDSVISLVPKIQLAGSVDESFEGLQAEILASALAEIDGLTKETGATVIFINGLRDKEGMMFSQRSFKDVPGGKALKLSSSIRIGLESKSWMQEGDSLIGKTIEATIHKNMLDAPFQIALFDVIINKGLDKVGEVISLAVELDIIKLNGSWYSYNDKNIGQGVNKTRANLIADIPTLVDIRSKILEVGNFGR